MKRILLSFFSALPFLIFAQSGCTDSEAQNYDPSAVQNNGTCTYTITYDQAALRGVLSPYLHESSGLIYTDGNLWSHNDNGNEADIFKIDTSDGHIIQTVYIDNYTNIDWEDITADSTYIYIGDFGNNNGNRTNLRILKIAKSDIGSGTEVHVNAEAIFFSYSDQISLTENSSSNFDCEAVTAIGDSLYLFTKDHGDHATRVYRLPKTPGTYGISPYTGYYVYGKITGADYNPNTKEVALIGYESKKTGSFIWIFSDFQNNHFFSGNKRRIIIGTKNSAWQTEGITYDTNNRWFISCETAGTIPASLYTLDKSDFRIAGITKPITTSFTGRYYPNPAREQLTIEYKDFIVEVAVKNMLGETLFSEEVHQKSYTLHLENMQYIGGLHTIVLRTSKESFAFKAFLE